MESSDADLAEFEKTGNIRSTTDLVKRVSEKGLKNVYAASGTAFAKSVVANPRFAAVLIGQLVNGMGVERVVYGSDAVFYGSPQWQIEALRRLEIPDDLMKKMGWKTKLGAADGPVKRKILGENSARLYRYPVKTAFQDITGDQIALINTAYQRAGIERNHGYSGHVAKPEQPQIHAANLTPLV